jgi:hypothetical protein
MKRMLLVLAGVVGCSEGRDEYTTYGWDALGEGKYVVIGGAITVGVYALWYGTKWIRGRVHAHIAQRPVAATAIEDSSRRKEPPRDLRILLVVAAIAGLLGGVLGGMLVQRRTARDQGKEALERATEALGEVERLRRELQYR